MKKSTFFILMAVIAVNLAVWIGFNRKVPDQPDWTGKIQGVSFSPYHEGQDAMKKIYPRPDQIDSDLRVLKGQVNSVRTYSSMDGFENIPGMAVRYGFGVTAGAWLDKDLEKNEKEISNLIRNAKIYTSTIKRVIVGNESTLRGDLTVEQVIQYIRRVREQVPCPVSTAEPWHVWINHPELAKNVDYIAIHVLPFWERVPIDQAVTWVIERYNQVQQAFPDKPVLLAEVGWPSLGERWGEQHFPKRNVKIITRYGAIPLLFWSPWDKPYAESKPPDQFGLNHILNGKWDAYIDQWAQDARTWGKPLLVAWGLEMNGTWFPWSGIFYGGGEKISAGNSTVYKGPDTFKKAYRYVVDRVRAKGATNIQWIFHVNHTTLPKEKWNEFAAYYPGPEYVDWLGMSVYGMMNKWQGWAPFYEAFYHAYEEICLIDPIKPVIVAEWGVGEFPAKGNKGEWLTTALNIMKTQSPRVKAAVYWHERWQNEDETYSNLRISSSPESIAAYRQGISDAYWIDRPIFAPVP